MVQSIIKSRSPDFFCIGAQKAGTTWLNENLRKHPDLWLPPVKELQYFNQLHIPSHKSWTQKHREIHASTRLSNYVCSNKELHLPYIRLLALLTDPDIGEGWYRRVFGYAPEGRLCGDMTPEYSLLPGAGIEHMLRVAPEAKFIFILRDPIDRAWSHLRMNVKRGALGEGMDTATALIPDVILRSEYHKILTLWRSILPADRLFVGIFDDIVNRPNDFLRDIVLFLGLPFREDLFEDSDEAVHRGIAFDRPEALYDAMRDIFAPTYAALAQEFPEAVKTWRARHY